MDEATSIESKAAGVRLDSQSGKGTTAGGCARRSTAAESRTSRSPAQTAFCPGSYAGSNSSAGANADPAADAESYRSVRAPTDPDAGSGTDARARAAAGESDGWAQRQGGINCHRAARKTHVLFFIGGGDVSSRSGVATRRSHLGRVTIAAARDINRVRTWLRTASS